jgi:hypothetical protein
LKGIIFEEGSVLKEIGKNAFERCGIERIIIPRSVEILSGSCFGGCKNLKVIVFEEGSVLRNGESNLEAILSRYHCGRVVIGKDISCIGEGCFSGWSQLTEIVFEEGSVLTEIGKNAFEGCGIARVIIPRSVETLNESCLMDAVN